MRSSQLSVRALLAAFLLSSAASYAAESVPKPGARNLHWVASWGTAVMVPEGQNELAGEHWQDASVRQIVRTALGGDKLRVRISNAFGTTPLMVEGASVALALAPGKPDVDPKSHRRLTFSGHNSIMVPAGAEYYSDPVLLTHPVGADLAISMHFRGAPTRQTGHPGARTHTFLTKGDKLADAAWPEATKVTRWYLLSDVEVLAPANIGAVVAIGDSITDGYGTTPDANERWTDVLAKRLRENGGALGVVNAGIGGGRMLRDGLGPNMAARFERDVLGRSGVTHAIVFIGVNDLGVMRRNGDDIPAARQQMLADLKTAHTQIVERAHTKGICMVGATVTPYTGGDYYKPGLDNEADRVALNDWIRNSGVYDAVADLDAALRDPAKPAQLKAEFDSGDHLHPSIAGLRAIAEAIPLNALRRCSIRAPSIKN